MNDSIVSWWVDGWVAQLVEVEICVNPLHSSQPAQTNDKRTNSAQQKEESKDGPYKKTWKN